MVTLSEVKDPMAALDITLYVPVCLYLSLNCLFKVTA